MTDLLKLVDDHANLWRRVGTRSPWVAPETAQLLIEAREASKQLKAEFERLRAELDGKRLGPNDTICPKCGEYIVNPWDEVKP